MYRGRGILVFLSQYNTHDKKRYQFSRPVILPNFNIILYKKKYS